MTVNGRMTGARPRVGLACVLLLTAGLSVAAYVPALPNAFVFDDHAVIETHSLVIHDGPWYRFLVSPWWPPDTSNDKLYRPLSLASYRWQMVLSGASVPTARGVRWGNIMLHALTGWAVAILAWRYGRSCWAGAFAGVLFAVHPVHVEAVVTGTGRAEVLSACCSAWLVVSYVGSRRADGTRHPAFHALHFVLLFAALMSKEHAVFVWPVLLAIDVQHRRQRGIERGALEPWRAWLNRIAAVPHASFLLAMAIFMLLRFGLFGWHYTLPADVVSPWIAPLTCADACERVLTPFRLLWIVAQLLVNPGRLCPIWSFPATMPASGPSGDVLLGLLLAGGLLAWVGWIWRRGQPVSVMWFWLVMALLLPVHGVSLAHYLFAERWLYLPTVPLFVGLAVLLRRAGVWGALVGLLLAGVLLPACWRYGRAFADDLTMSREIVARQPASYLGHRNLAISLLEADRPEEALKAAQETVARFCVPGRWGERWPVPMKPYHALARAYLACGDGRGALEAVEAYDALASERGMFGLGVERAEAEALLAACTAASP